VAPETDGLPTDAEYVARALAGQPEARAALVGRHHTSCMRLARHLLGDDTDAEDAVQETFIRAFGALRRYEERDTFRAWLYRILVHRCRTAARGRARRRERFVNDERAVLAAGVPGHARLLDAQRALAHALGGLDLSHREAFLLKIGEEMEYDEISRLTGVGVGALKMRVKRARDHVRAHWPERNDG
jgi:RNA polymerase sigma-70 factor (ECF subfamily)